MIPSVTIKTEPLEHAAMDYAFLRQEGIRHLERMAGAKWTDFNTHDPGITILEQLCYAITDLGYRIAHEMPDLIADKDGSADQSLYSPAQVLTSHPVTLTDLRKLVLDVEGVKNAWVEKVEKPWVDRVHPPTMPLVYHTRTHDLRLPRADSPAPLATKPIYVKGLYQVMIELVEEGGTAVLREVTRRLHANRCLCTDFAEIRVLAPRPVRGKAIVEIDPVDDAEQILLNIFKQVANYLSPRVRFATLQDMLAAGKPIDEIFDGPELVHGFIDSEELARLSRRKTIHTSDLIHVLMDVPGVKVVRQVYLAERPDHKGSTATLRDDECWSLQLDACPIIMQRGNFPVRVDVGKVVQAYKEWLRNANGCQQLPREQRDIVPPQGRDRRLGNYFSIQHQFPALYGIGPMGLSASASPQRQAQTKQFKAYLMFFDQLLANYFAQLANAKELLSFHSQQRDGSSRSYFSLMVDDVRLGLDAIRAQQDKSAHWDTLQRITEDPHADSQEDAALARRSRFLNHLLARFSEKLTNYSLILADVEGDGSDSESSKEGMQMVYTKKQKLARDKQDFLKQYPQISSPRGTAYDYLRPPGKDNVSGLEHRIRLKLGLVETDGERFFLVEHILLRAMEADAGQRVPLLTAAPREEQQGGFVTLLGATDDPYSLQLSFVFPNWPERFSKASYRQFVEQTVREQTPAHLTVYIHWLDEDAMQEFENVYCDWLQKLHRYWAQKIGI